MGYMKTEVGAGTTLGDDQVGDRGVVEEQAGDAIVAGSPGLSGRQLKVRVMVADAGALVVGFVVAFLLQRAIHPVPRWIAVDHLALALASIPAFALGAGLNKLYLARANERQWDEVSNVLRAVGLGFLFLIAVSVAFKYNTLSRFWVFLAVIAVASAVLIERRVVRGMFASMRSRGALRRRILVVGTDAHAIGLVHAYRRRPELGYEVVGFVGDEDIGVREGVRVLGPLSELEPLLEAHRAVGVSVSLPGVSEQAVNDLTRRLTDRGYHVTLSSSLRDIAIGRLRPQEVDGRTMLYVEPTVRGGWRAAAKRGFDIVGASVILLCTAPVLAAAALAVKLTSRGPILFRQVRLGRNGAPLEVLKLRSMVVDAEQRLDDLRHLNEADGVLFKMARDPRVTPVGRVLRKLSIDELPQLWCVLRGDMSMVGPRPMLPSEGDRLDPHVRSERLRVLPGLTGLWQVSGRSYADSEDCRYDRYYVDNWSLSHDLLICLRTIPTVISGRGAA